MKIAIRITIVLVNIPFALLWAWPKNCAELRVDPPAIARPSHGTVYRAEPNYEVLPLLKKTLGILKTLDKDYEEAARSPAVMSTVSWEQNEKRLNNELKKSMNNLMDIVCRDMPVLDKLPSKLVSIDPISKNPLARVWLWLGCHALLMIACFIIAETFSYVHQNLYLPSLEELQNDLLLGDIDESMFRKNLRQIRRQCFGKVVAILVQSGVPNSLQRWWSWFHTLRL